jgi:hypothetical protein
VVQGSGAGGGDVVERVAPLLAERRDDREDARDEGEENGRGSLPMELKIGVHELARALARSQGIVEKKSTMPILAPSVGAPGAE